MKCQPTNVPPAGEIDIPALREKYRQERDKRIRREGQNQYVRPVGDFADTYEGDPHMPVQSRAPLSEEIDVAVLGAGLSGLMAGAQLSKADVTNVRIIDHAGDFGGVWYWNRYPGVQCDNDAYCYLPMLEEARERYTYLAASGGDADAVRGADFPVHVGMCGWVLRNERSLLFRADVERDLE